MNKDLIKYAVLGVGAWYVWKTYLSGPSTTTAPSTTYHPPTTTTTPPTTTQPPASTTPPATTPPVYNTGTIPTDLKSKLIIAAGGSPTGSVPMLNWDQWNYYLAQVIGRPGPAFEDPLVNASGIGGNRTQNISVDAFLLVNSAWLHGNGLSGLGPWALGDLAELGLWTSNRVPQQGWAGVEHNPHFVWRT